MSHPITSPRRCVAATLALLLVGAMLGCSESTPAAPGGDPTEPLATDGTSAAVSLGLAADDIALIWTELGGCRLGTQSWCRTWTIRTDGTFTAERPASTAIPALTRDGVIDPSLTNAWLASIAEPDDRRELQRRVRGGPCRSAEGGVDQRAEVPAINLSMNSCQFDLDADEPALNALRAVVVAAIAQHPVDGSSFLPCDLDQIGPDGEC